MKSRDNRVNWPMLAAIYACVMSKPGCTQADIARRLQVRRSTVYQKLPTLQDCGFLLYEDGHGCLYPFGINAGVRFVATDWQ